MSLARKTRYTRNAALRYLSQRGWEVLWQLSLYHHSPLRRTPAHPPGYVRLLELAWCPELKEGPCRPGHHGCPQILHWVSSKMSLALKHLLPTWRAQVCARQTSSCQGLASLCLPRAMPLGSCLSEPVRMFMTRGPIAASPFLHGANPPFSLLLISKSFPFHCPS